MRDFSGACRTDPRSEASGEPAVHSVRTARRSEGAIDKGTDGQGENRTDDGARGHQQPEPWSLHRWLPEPPRLHAVSTRGSPRARVSGAVREVLMTRTDVVLIVASGLGYFFFTGIRTFAVEYLRGRFGLGQSAGSNLVVLIGAAVGVLVTGRLADRIAARGYRGARPVVAGVAFLVACVLFAPGLLLASAVGAVVLLFLGAKAYGGRNPPLDAARLDVVRCEMWGRAEGVRTLLSTLFQAAAPLAFGYTSTLFGGGATSAVPAVRRDEQVASGHGLPLAHTFLVMLVPVAIAGLLLIVAARRTYPGDTAAASDATSRGGQRSPTAARSHP